MITSNFYETDLIAKIEFLKFLPIIMKMAILEHAEENVKMFSMFLFFLLQILKSVKHLGSLWAPVKWPQVLSFRSSFLSLTLTN